MKNLLLLLTAALTSMAMSQSIPRPEHPRPDMRRDEWMSLNGSWDFAETDDDKDVSWVHKDLFPDKISVPFCRESKLSGLGRTGFIRNVWYRRTFRVPSSWKSKRVRLHIGASDWRTTVFLNGVELHHVGGQAPVILDCGDAFNGKENTLVIRAFDDTRSGLQALGKQCPELNSYGCLYTRTTGIWQSVWIEGVGDPYIADTKVVADVARGTFTIGATVAGDLPAGEIRARVFDGKKEVASAKAPIIKFGAKLVLKIPHPKLWGPGKPNLYDIELTTERAGQVMDKVTTYSGMRDVSIKGRAILINDKPVFQRLVLDQGFYPDGIWTAPSDAALKRDIELSMAAGFNGARLHEKVFEPRFLYWADKLGYLVWGEFPNWGLNYKDPRINGPVMEEWQEILTRDWNHPSIVGWCPFNETPAEAGALQDKVVAMTRALDPTRPVIDTSGYVHSVNDPMVLDAHDYDQNPTTFKARYDAMFGSSVLPARYGSTIPGNIPFMVSEYGGIGWDVSGGWGYGDAPKSLEEFYTRFKGLSDALLDNRNMFGFCYTQLTDVEQEHNGVYKYDRTPKFDVARLKKVLSRKAAIESSGPGKTVAPLEWRVLVGSARDPGDPVWRSAQTDPGPGWNQTDHADASWYASPGGFGNKGGWEKEVRSDWSSSDIWLRREFTSDSAVLSKAMLVVHYDNAAEVYLNGKEIWRSARGAWNDAYQGFDVTKALKGALRKGKNLIAVHCHQDTGGQFIDLALLVRR